MEGCCPKGSWPALKTDYVPRFAEEELGGLNCYVAGSNETKAIILLHDIFGVNSGRTKAIADSFNDEGYLTVVPDIFRGDAIGEGSDVPSLIPNWAPKYHHSLVKLEISSVVGALKQRGVSSIFFGGFCWGSWAMFVYFGEGVDEVVKGGVCYHPSLGLESRVFGGDPNRLAKEIERPVYLLSAGNDQEIVQEGGEIIQTLKTKPFADQCHVKNFLHLAHGWVNRGDISQDAVLSGVHSSLSISLSYFSSFSL